MRTVARPWLTAVRCFPVSESEARRSYPEFPDVAGFVEVLNRRGVRFVVIGGSAVQFWVPEMITHDVDFSPATDRANWNASLRPFMNWLHASAPTLCLRAWHSTTTRHPS